MRHTRLATRHCLPLACPSRLPQSGKRHRMREARLWLVDPPAYYSPVGGLLTYDAGNLRTKWSKLYVRVRGVER